MDSGPVSGYGACFHRNEGKGAGMGGAPTKESKTDSLARLSPLESAGGANAVQRRTIMDAWPKGLSPSEFGEWMNAQAG